ncbi:MAG: SHOCT domain-containing protein [Gammaproteobacteria bacterium]
MTFAALLLSLTLIAGCGTLDSENSETADEPAPGAVTPTSRGVYTDDAYLHLRLEPQDDNAAPNDHPVDLKPKDIRRWLVDLEVRPEESDEPVSLIPADQLPELSALLAQALGDAGSDQDVVFHSFRRAGSWFGSERRATTARVFYRDDALNLIFGELDDFYSEQINRNLQPLKPGFRDTGTDLSGELIASPQIAFVDGRADWIRLDRNVIAAAPATPRAAAPVPAIAAPTANPMPTDPRWSQLEERLLILDGLRSKGLITHEDYETKKRELLEILDL